MRGVPRRAHGLSGTKAAKFAARLAFGKSPLLSRTKKNMFNVSLGI